MKPLTPDERESINEFYLSHFRSDPVKGFDAHCYDLAVLVLEDQLDPVPVLMAQELAQVIQDAIEDWLEGKGK